MKIRLIHIAVLLSLVTACKREIQVKVADKPPVLVVDAVLMQDSFVKVKLSETQNITDNSPAKIVSDAVIEMFDKDTQIIDVLSHQGNGVYTSIYKPLSDKRYLFKLNRNGKVYWVDEYVPDTIDCLIQDTSRIVFQGKLNFFQINLKLNDPVGSNYYGIKLRRYYKQINGADTQHLSEWVELETIDFILTEDPQTRFSNQHLVFSDKYFDGKTQFLKFGVSGIFEKGRNTEALELYVSSYSKSGYDYYGSVNEHLFYQNDPFSQPTLIRGNVSNAFGGIIGEYTFKFLMKF